MTSELWNFLTRYRNALFIWELDSRRYLEADIEWSGFGPNSKGGGDD